jgi:hypothetical protein
MQIVAAIRMVCDNQNKKTWWDDECEAKNALTRPINNELKIHKLPFYAQESPLSVHW